MIQLYVEHISSHAILDQSLPNRYVRTTSSPPPSLLIARQTSPSDVTFLDDRTQRPRERTACRPRRASSPQPGKTTDHTPSRCPSASTTRCLCLVFLRIHTTLPYVVISSRPTPATCDVIPSPPPIIPHHRCPLRVVASFPPHRFHLIVSPLMLWRMIASATLAWRSHRQPLAAATRH